MKVRSTLSLIRRIPTRDFAKIRKLSLILRVMPYSMLTYSRLSALYELATCLERQGVNGSFVECGVWNGGSAAILAKAAEHSKNNRSVWLFDSWQGLPEPTRADTSHLGEQARKGMALGSPEKVTELLFTKLNLNNNGGVHLVKGWFSDTLPTQKTSVGRIALLHLDCDWYNSIKTCLEELYDSVVKGGYIVVDDYGHWRGCKKAVDEFIENSNLDVKIRHIDYTGVYFQK